MSAGAFGFSLPAISAANAGCEIAVKNTTALGTAFTLIPAGADTVEGAAAPFAVGGALSAVTVVSDGVSNWMVI